MPIKIKKIKVIDLKEWNKLVTNTYSRPYDLQQQDECRFRGLFKFKVPFKEFDDFDNESIKEEANVPDHGVKFEAWLKRDPKEPLKDEDDGGKENWLIKLWWHRNFYPEFYMVANDLYKKGLLERGNYGIDIDW